MPEHRSVRYSAHYRQWLPSDLPNLQLWTRFNKGITVTGAGVSQWDDQSGNGNHLKQGTDTNRPSKESDGAILFDGVDNYLKADAFTLNQPESIYILFKSISWSSNDYIFDGHGGSVAVLRQAGTTPQLALYAGAALASNSDLAVGTYGIASVVFNGANSLLAINNGTPLEGNAGALNAGGFTLGALGTEDGVFSNIQVKEVIVYSAAHDESNRKQLIGYLASLGGLSL